MAELKTQPTSKSARAFVKSVADTDRRADCRTLLAFMSKLTGKKATMWGDKIIGFGRYHYRYKSGHSGSWFVTGFSPRKRDLTIYIMLGFDRYPELMSKLGRFRTGKSCLYLRSLDDVDLDVLESLIAASVADLAEIYDCD